MSLLSVLEQLAAGDDREVGVERAGAQRDEDVERVVREHGGERMRPHDPGGDQGGLGGGVAVDAQIALRARLLGAGLVVFENDEPGAARAQRLRERRAEAAEAADDDVPLELVDLIVHALEPHDLVDLAEGDELHQRAGEEDDAGAAEHDQRDGDDVQRRRVDRADFAETHRVDRDDHHVEGIAEAPADRHVGDGGGGHHDDRVDDADGEVADG